MATIVVSVPGIGGTAFTPVAAAGGGDQFTNTGKEFYYINNGGVGSITVTFKSPNTCNFNLANNAVHDDVVTVGAGASQTIGPFPVARFNDANNFVQVQYSGVTSVTVALLRSA